ncbi:MAG: FAD-binding oxidoreductase [Pseudomonadota bacterium]
MRACDTAVIGAGIAGIAAAEALTAAGIRQVVLIDRAQPMALTSAQSGENYRNWWPHPVMTQFTDDSITRMEILARDDPDRIRLTRRGYVLATRLPGIDGHLTALRDGYGETGQVRLHSTGGSSYRPSRSADWRDNPDGVDVLTDPAAIRAAFPALAEDVATVLHIRRAGDVSSQGLGQLLLDRFVAVGGRRVTAEVTGIDASGPRFTIALSTGERVRADRVINAAGPFLQKIGGVFGETLPVKNVLQQKIAFEDSACALPRDMPFTIDLDAQTLGWPAEDRAVLAADPATAWLTNPMPGGIHRRPDGGECGKWVKLGWAYNAAPSAAEVAPKLDPTFPDIVLRGAARLTPSLAQYIGRLPRSQSHYGGYYTMTEENWPLIGPMGTPGAYVLGALSGFGTMAACQAGTLAAAWVTGAALPDYANALSPARYGDPALLHAARQCGNGVL